MSADYPKNSAKNVFKNGGLAGLQNPAGIADKNDIIPSMGEID